MYDTRSAVKVQGQEVKGKVTGRHNVCKKSQNYQ